MRLTSVCLSLRWGWNLSLLSTDVLLCSLSQLLESNVSGWPETLKCGAVHIVYFEAILTN